MKISKKIKNAYEKLPVPDKEDVLPAAATEDAPKKRRFTPRLAYSLASLVLVASVVTAGAVGIVSRVKTAEGAGDTNAGYRDGVIGEAPRRRPGETGAFEITDSLSKAEKSADAMYEFSEMPSEAEYALDGDYYGDYNGYSVDPRAGLLTASEWSDVKNLAEWYTRLADEYWKSVIDERGFYSAGIVTATVTGGGAPIYNAEVTLEAGGEVWTSRTDITGRAYLFYPASAEGASATVKVGGEAKSVTLSSNGGQYASVSFDIDPAEVGAKQLDLMLMVDTTGSMGDELEYLKAELSDVVGRVAEADGALSIRVSVNFYRDEGDDYVVKYFDFRENVDESVSQIKEQYSEGGGDFPEAVHTALENAVDGHTWREDAVKICFLVLDAPPHSEDEVQGVNESLMKSIKNASALGIKIIPVASSGVDTETEVILRSFALMTGGTYIYLTNDSGIGGDHLEATVSEKNVEPLNECMIRVVCEYCGIDYEKGEVQPAPQKTYQITCDRNLVNVLIDAPESAKNGETVEIKTSTITDTDLKLFANGEEIERTHYDSDYWGYTFVMPAEDVIVTAEFTGTKG